MCHDAHVHFGYWRTSLDDETPLYRSPKEVVGTLTAAGVDRFLASSSSVRVPDTTRDFILDEYRELVRLAPGRCYPLLWMTGDAFDADPDLAQWAPDDVPWRGLKLHNEDSLWLRCPDRLRRAMSIARERGWVVQFHTGGGRSDAGLYAWVCEEFPEVKIDLAHTRPADEAIALALRFPNVYLDLSFAPEETFQAADAAARGDSGLAERVMFGSDLPVFYDYNSEHEWDFDVRIALVRKCFGALADNVLSRNFERFVS